MLHKPAGGDHVVVLVVVVLPSGVVLGGVVQANTDNDGCGEMHGSTVF